jgi:DNA-3-methyladenine glycosylase II
MQRIETLQDIENGLDALIAADRRLAVVRQTAGSVPLRRSEPGFESLASIIVAQQVSKASADSIWRRLKGAIDPLTPETFIAAGEDAWRLAGLSRPKQRTLVHICDAVLGGGLDLDGLCSHPVDQATALMTAIKGVGPWTAEVYLLFAAGHADVFPAGDVALQNAVAAAFGHEVRPDAAALRELAQAWSPWRGVAARLFWAYYAATRGRDAAPPA